MDFIALLQEQFSEIRTVLTGYTSDKGNFTFILLRHHDGRLQDDARNDDKQVFGSAPHLTRPYLYLIVDYSKYGIIRLLERSRKRIYLFAGTIAEDVYSNK